MNIELFFAAGIVIFTFIVIQFARLAKAESELDETHSSADVNEVDTKTIEQH